MKKILVGLFIAFSLINCVNAEEATISTNETTTENTTKTETGAKLDEFIQKIAPNNTLTMVVPKSFTKYDIVGGFLGRASFYIKNYDAKGEFRISVVEISEDLSTAHIFIQQFDLTTGNGTSISKNLDVSLKWADEDLEKTKIAQEYANKIENKKNFVFEDLALIAQFMSSTEKDEHEMLISTAYSAAYKQFASVNDEVEYLVYPYSYRFLNVYSDSQVVFSIGSNGVFYLPLENIKSVFYKIIYIPDDTENNYEAYIKAAKTRIDNYFGENDIKIEKAKKFAEYFPNYSNFSESELNEKINELFKVEFNGEYTLVETGEYYYNVTINGETYPFAIVKDSSKIEKPANVTTDLTTGASISVNTNEVPIDSVINVSTIEETTETFKNIVNKIKAKADEIMVFDFKLFSPSKNDYITKIETGEFIVSVPIIDALKDKKLVVYYIDDDGKIEKHPVTVKDGIATFTTTHFSIYTIAEDTGIEITVPNTYDGIMNFIIMGIIGIVGIGIFFTLRKREN